MCLWCLVAFNVDALRLPLQFGFAAIIFARELARVTGRDLVIGAERVFG